MPADIHLTLHSVGRTGMTQSTFLRPSTAFELVNAFAVRSGWVWIKAMIASRCDGRCVSVESFRLCLIERIISVSHWGGRPKTANTNAIVGNAGKWNGLLPGSTRINVSTDFWNVDKKLIAHGCELSLSNITWICSFKVLSGSGSFEIASYIK